MANILIIDDEVLLARSLAKSLVHRGHECQVAATAEDGLQLIRAARPDAVLLDLQLPGMSGQDALRQIVDFDPNIVVVIATAYGTVSAAVDVMRAGAADFLRKPLDIEEVTLTLDRALTTARMRDALTYYRNRDVELAGTDRLIGESRAMAEVRSKIARMAGLDLPKASDCPPVLLTGETGTGKDLAARIIHLNSKFSSQPFIEVNCPLLPRGLEEAELFGFERGAFTDAKTSKRGLFEAAEGGTIFLNEIGDLPVEVQVKLLQVIEQKTLRHIGGLRDISVDTRIIAATNRDLLAMTDAGEFRRDLYHRLYHFFIEMPPLRVREDDVVLLAQHFLETALRKYGGAQREFSSDAVDAIKAYNWPGNLRELDHVIERAVVLSCGADLTAADLQLPAASSARHRGNGEEWFAGKTWDQIERQVLESALAKALGNVSEAARALGIGREALRYRIQKHGLETDRTP